jgi:flagellar motor switch/type III secretory pathway protein FliN
LVANGMRETLRDVFGDNCELMLGEPVAIDRTAWSTLASAALCFLTRGRQTDVVLLIQPADARLLVARAFGERDAPEAGAADEPRAGLSALELHALERIVGRCSAAFDPLYAERRGTPQLVAPGALPPCVGFFDVRVRAPVAFELGIGIVRDLPDPGPSGALPPAALGRVPIGLRVEFARGTIAARTLLDLAVGDVIPLQTQVGARAGLKIADRFIATGTAGMAANRYSFEIDTMHAMGAQS